MPGGSSKKKKKPASNPARGFATTSIASKSKESPQTATPEIPDVSHSVKDSITAATSKTNETPLSVTAGSAQNGPKELHELSPDELEKRLEEAELQSLADKHSAKSLREAARHISKLQTDCRLLRPQGQPLLLRTFLPSQILDQLLQFASEEIRTGRVLSVIDEPAAQEHLPEDDTVLKLWTLQRAILSLGFSVEQSRNALDYITHHLPASDSSNFAIWGLEECLDWLVLTSDEDVLPTYDPASGKPLRSPDLEVANEPESLSDEPRQPLKTEDVGAAAKSEAKEAVSVPEQNIDVSDLDSDMEPDELVTCYLRTKARLYDLQPELVEPPSRSKGNKGNLRSLNPAGAGSRKLQKKMQQIEADPIFDKDEADLRWASERILLEKTKAERKRLNLPQKVQPKISDDRINSRPSNEVTGNEPNMDEQEDDILGEMFGDALRMPDEDEIGGPIMPESTTITVRDFGIFKGVSPRRTCEEACRVRDPGVSFTYKLLSQVGWSNRSSVTIAWSKAQELSVLDLPSVKIKITSRSLYLEMVDVACPSREQSESYVSTLALFIVCWATQKEDKSYLRLPPPFRELYQELVDLKKDELDSKDRAAVRVIRDIVRARNDKLDEEDGEVIYMENFKKRSSRTHSPLPGNGSRANNNQLAQSLADMWALRVSTPAYQKMLPVRHNLPMARFRNEAVASVVKHQVTILCGETGCGKSTQMPAYILEHELSLGKSCKIYCTEPRRISAITLAQRVAEELGEGKGGIGTAKSLVGYAIRLESKTGPNTRLVYATTGIVLRMLESSDGFADVTHIIIDEVHERSIETDFLLIILRKLISQRPELKVILMSATVDAQRFSKYFYGAPILNVPGRTFPVETLYLEDAIERTGHVVDEKDNARDEADLDAEIDEGLSQNKSSPLVGLDTAKYNARTKSTLAKYNEYALDYQLIARLIEMLAFDAQYQQYNQAILVFLPGIQEIRRLNDLISGTAVSQHYVIHQLHSTISSEDQQAAFTLPPHGLGKIVLSSNIAETGVTIPDVTCVIDTGKHKEMRFDERRQISRLVESFISRANAKQRRGRAGRVQQGLCFHLFTKNRHDKIMSDQQTPEMLRLSLQDLIMRVKICKLGDIQSTLASALDPPSPKNIRRAIDALIEVEALTSAEELTSLGQQLSKLPLDPYLGKLVLYGSIFGCLDVALSAAAILTSKSPFVSPVGMREAADNARQAFRKGDSDLLTEYNAYAAWRRVCSAGIQGEMQFCRKSCLSPQTLAGIEDLKAQLLGTLADAGFVQLSPGERRDVSRISNSVSRRRTFVSLPPHTTMYTPVDDGTLAGRSAVNETLMNAVISWAFYPKLLIRDGKGWRNVATTQSITIHPTSILRTLSPTALGKITFLSFYSILQSSSGQKNYNANSLSPTQALPLLLLAGSTVSWHPVAHVVSIDGARMRFGVPEGVAADSAGWKTFVGIKFLRRRLEETVSFRWRKPGEQLPWRLQRWWQVWTELVEGWRQVTERVNDKA